MLKTIKEFVEAIHADGFTNVVLLGMGGSSLAPEVMSVTYSAYHSKVEGLQFEILDSTDPRMVEAVAARNAVESTLFIVSSKSGSTSEVFAMYEYFMGLAKESLGSAAGKHFVAITDPGSKLQRIAIEENFRRVFLGDPSIGGRFSALSVFGLVPAALIGYDLDKLIANSAEMADYCKNSNDLLLNPGYVLGGQLASAWENGRDKLTVVADEEYRSFGSWLEQLIAESTGKEGKGVVPVDLEPMATLESYGNDRVFVYFRSNGSKDEFVKSLEDKFPVLIYDLDNEYDIGREFFRWEFATAVLCALMKVNAFDQPDVQDNKTRTESKLEDFAKYGILETPAGTYVNGVLLNSPNAVDEENLNANVSHLLSSAKDQDYIAINAYIERNAENETLLEELRSKILNKYQKATTLGFGPRFLHSTGQLHKGGPNTGVFLQLNADAVTSLPIPHMPYSFEVLERAQSIGDYEALVARDRRILRLTFPSMENMADWIRSY